MTLQDYLQAPCAALSIPYWKSKQVQIPPQMHIVHHREFDAAAYPGYSDEPYFRLQHDLKQIGSAGNNRYTCRTAADADLPLMAELINRSYTDLSVTLEQLQGYRKSPAYAPDLWIVAHDVTTGTPIGCGIADFDPEAKEGVLEWIQVLPDWRGKKAGQFIVNELLRRLADRADFATVSGKVNNATNPERLYRKCGFTGEDIWHILTEK